ncbi:MAG: carbohydrate ABC transporter permease [Anaerolineae bacterium]
METLLTLAVVLVAVPLALVLYITMAETLLQLLPESKRPLLRPWLWVGPALLALTVYLIYPVLNTIYLSFQDSKGENFVGVENYLYIFTDRDTLIAYRNNLLWLVLFTGATVSLGLLIAVLTDRVRYEAWVKSLIFLPMAISFVAAGAIWKFMLDFNPKLGLVNAFLKGVLDVNPIAWLQTGPANNFVLIAVGIWMWTGFCTVILSAGLKGIPKEVLEAARVDGANEIQIFWQIIIPMMSSTIAVVATTMVINVLKVFDIVYVMTSGLHNTDVIANRMFQMFYVERQDGRSAALAVVLLLAIIPFMILNIRRFRQQEAMR